MIIRNIDVKIYVVIIAVACGSIDIQISPLVTLI